MTTHTSEGPRLPRTRKGRQLRTASASPPFLPTPLLAAIAVVCVFCLTQSMHAQGGPPFRTDDPDTPGNGHLEINLGFLGDRNPSTGTYQVPDVDINYGLGDRIQLKYELPAAVRETRPQPATDGSPSTPGSVIGGLGESLLGIKWRFYEHHPDDMSLHQGFGTGLRALFAHGTRHTQPARVAGDAPGAADKAAVTGKTLASFELGTYPQIYLNNPTDATARGLVSAGPNVYLPIEVSGRIGGIRYNADAGYNFGNRTLAQSWNRGFLVGHEFSDTTEMYIELYDLQDANRKPSADGLLSVKQRETTLGLGGRQVLNHARTLNLLLMAGRSFQKPSTATGQPGWIAYVGLQILLGPQEF